MPLRRWVVAGASALLLALTAVPAGATGTVPAGATGTVRSGVRSASAAVPAASVATPASASSISPPVGPATYPTGDPTAKGGTSGRRSFPVPAAGGHKPAVNAGSAAGNPAAGNPAAGNPAANIPPSPAFPDRCGQAYQSADCTTVVIAALNHARRVMGLPDYALPVNFTLMTPAYQFLTLSNADRSLAGLTSVTAFNPTLDATAQQAANLSDDPGVPGAAVPTTIAGQGFVGWAANWAGGMSPLEAYYDWMYFDGVGSTNLDCNSPTDSGCWGHRENTLWDFGAAEVALGVGGAFSGGTYGTSWTELYWAYRTTGPRIPRLPAAVAMSATTGPAAGGTRITIRGSGLETTTAVAFGTTMVTPLYRSATSLVVVSPAGSGVPFVRVVGDGGTSAATVIATFSYLAAPGPGSFVPLAPARLLDTRTGNGVNRVRVASLATVKLPVLGRGGVPASGVSAVVLNVLAVNPAAGGFLTVYASGAVRPGTSNLNFIGSQTVANLTVAPVGPDGKVAIFNGSTGPLDMVGDVSGYYLAGSSTAPGLFHSLVPARLLDTRAGLGATRAKVAANGTVRVAVTGHGGVPAGRVSSVFVNVTVVNPAAAGFLTVYSGVGARPIASNLNFGPGQTVPDLVLSPVGADGRIAIFNGSAGTADILADVVGYLAAGPPNTRGAIVPVTPSRSLDTRTGVGVATFPPFGFAPPAGQVFTVPAAYRLPLVLTGRNGIPSTGVSAVVLNLTVVAPNATGYFTAYPDGGAVPIASSINFPRGRTVPNLVIVPVGRNGLVNLYNGTPSFSGLIVDVAGYVLG